MSDILSLISGPILTFFGGTAFRLIFGGVMDFIKDKQDHQKEMDLMKLQSTLDDQRHKNNLEQIRLQKELGIEEIKVSGDVADQKVMADAFLEAVKKTGNPTGVKWIDGWNGGIRPAGASVALLAWVGTMIQAGLLLSDFDRQLISAFLGIFVGDRIHTNSKK